MVPDGLKYSPKRLNPPRIRLLKIMLRAKPCSRARVRAQGKRRAECAAVASGLAKRAAHIAKKNADVDYFTL